MGLRLRGVGKIILGLCVVLLLDGCSEDFGPDQYGRKVTASSLDGQWLIINYWAQWCAPCRTEIPELNILSEELRGEPVKVIGVNFDGLQGEALLRAVKDFDIRFTVLAEDPAVRLGLPHNEVLPVTYIVDQQGRLRERLLGEQTAVGLREQLQRLRRP
ncbi:TlpA disulfide reductase family protein [Pseudomonas sp. NCCP-436]|uniref:TlpA disulfide reductase family protein n=1 Tax=Pseudomonas sp. NCCP-436 TaxID=2842481 RepID=UPI001C827F97|nr:TlpA disulfide reductase family protein [Pseudomonas sp. NCCP-436]GIZ13236.1 thioredoxin [Pseudomonas sp. NCCP-436]